MPSELNDQLLEDASPRRRHRGGAVVAVAALVLSVGLVGYCIGKNSGVSEFDHETIQAKLVPYQRGIANQTELAVVAYSEQCYGFTGAACAGSAGSQLGCDPGLKATCTELKCVCPGGCAGADGTCGSAPYKKVGTKFTLSNKKWSGYWLFVQTVSLLSQLKVSAMAEFTFGGQQYFDLFELPGKFKGKKRYFLASNYWPAWVAAIRPTGSLLTASASLYGLYGVNLEHDLAPWDPQKIIVEVCSVRNLGYDQEIMIGGEGIGRTEWAYVHHGSWFVYGWDLSQDPGEGGYWTVSDTKMLEQLDDC